MSSQVKRAIFVLILSSFLVCLGMSLIFPVMPFIKNELHFFALDMGIMNSLFAFAQLIGSPIIGRISDKSGRKVVLVIGLLLFVVAESLFALTNSLIVMDISRTIGGLSAAMVVPTSNALAADITTPGQRAKVIGWLSAAFSGGLILGPGIGGVLARSSYKTPFWFAATLGLLSVICLAIMLPSDKKLKQLRTSTKPAIAKMKSDTNFWQDSWKLLSGPMGLLFILILVSAFGLVSFESIYSLYVNEVHHFTMANIALVLTLNGIISLLFQILLFNRMVILLGEKRLIRYCFFFAFLGTAWIMVAHQKWAVIIATLLVFTAFDLIRPAITTLLTKASLTDQGLVNGLNMSLTSVGNIIGPILSGALLDYNYHYPYFVVIVFMLISFFLTYKIHRAPTNNNQAPTEN